MNHLMKKSIRTILAGVLAAGCLWMPVQAAEPELGAVVAADEHSPTGYTVNFAYDAKDEADSISKVEVTGPFQYIDPAMDLKDEQNSFGPREYENGMYASNCAPGPFSWGYTEEMKDEDGDGIYETSFPITSGSFAYSYVITYNDGTKITIDDPANPSPAKLNANSNIATGDLTHSIVYGHYDDVKQSASPNLDFVLPADVQGTLSYVEYQGNLATDQDLGIYLPAGYDANREKPYKVIYASHGGGGNETDWFAMGHADNIMDNLGADAIVVTMDNSSYGWDFEKIEDNVINYIIPYMETNYHVSHEVKDRAFCGLSMGSMTTLHMFFDHPEMFGYFGAFSGTDMSAVTNDPKIDAAVLYVTVGTCDIASENVAANGEGQQIKYEDLIRWEAENDLLNFVDGGYIAGAHDWFVWSSSFKNFVDEICWSKTFKEAGASVFADEHSPSGYTVDFTYDAGSDTKNISKVEVTGPFQYIDPAMDLKDEQNSFGPREYENGMYASNCAPGPFSWGYTEEMIYNSHLGVYETSFPITSGSFAYSYVITYNDGTKITIDDLANPSPAKLNANSNIATGDLTHSIVYGHYDDVKQSASPNLDFVLPADVQGTLSYVEYQGNLAADQDLGIYLPAGYDANREEPYKVIYASHGGGGNETDWFAMGHADNIMDNLGADVIVVTMDNSSYGWDFEKIEDNVINYIIPYMEANYHVSHEVKDRAFCGLSMGSMTTLHMFFDHPEMFGYFGAFSGTDMSAVTENEHLDRALLYAAVGTCDIASENVAANGEGQQIKYEDLIRWEAENDLLNFVDGGYIAGAHDWFVWSQCFKTFAEDYCWTTLKAPEKPANPGNNIENPDDTKPSKPNDSLISTGDNASLVPYVLSGAGAVVILASAVYVKRKKELEAQ